ncbi:MAG: hypothetical protein SPG98_06545 [Porcincola intestinalis]|uniref:hypothetical protein n=1 Tax=Porcincola intestinalis TaxID=2606632 RepID=UPI002A91E7CF|nr:hypothetical protein [Porcincola intestinalis]MDY5332410.1 hypothetical protein [Porcincola intestinalis]
MVYLKTDDLEGNMDSFGKDKMIQNVLMPKITKIATQAGLDPAGFKPDEMTMENFYQTPFLNVMPDGSTYTPEYNYVKANMHFRILFDVRMSDPVDYRNSTLQLEATLFAKNLLTGKCFYFVKNGVWRSMPDGLFR